MGSGPWLALRWDPEGRAADARVYFQPKRANEYALENQHWPHAVVVNISDAARAAEMRSALEWYADHASYLAPMDTFITPIDEDRGERARKALGEKEDERIN